MKPVEKQRKSTLRKKEHEVRLNTHTSYKINFFFHQGCSYCRQSGQHYRVTASHTLKDSKDRVLCPFLRTQVCSLCMADGDIAHVFDDCPLRAFVKLPSRNTENQKVGSNKVYRRLNF